MYKMTDSEAIKNAVSITKTVCANPSTHIIPCEESAQAIAEFIRTLETHFKGED